MDIVVRIKQIGRELGFSWEDIASGLGITRASLHSRMKNPKMSTLEDIAGLLGVDVADFFREGEKGTFSASGACCPCCGASLRLVARK